MSAQVIDVTDGFKKSSLDTDIETRIQAHCARFGVSAIDAVKHFAVLSRRQMLKRFLAHVELFKLALDMPGDIVELGVFRGAGLMTWANLLEAYCIGDRTKVVYGFDNWKGFSALAPEDGRADEASGKTEGGFNPERYLEELKSAISIFDADRFIPAKPRVKLIAGQIEEEVPRFLQLHPGARFSLVHFDCDLYRPTRTALESLWPRVVRGGVVIFDEYAIADWPGESKAVDEFFADKPDCRLRTFQWTNTPGAYLIKP
jgi:hypothetical protein